MRMLLRTSASAAIPATSLNKDKVLPWWDLDLDSRKPYEAKFRKIQKNTWCIPEPRITLQEEEKKGTSFWNEMFKAPYIEEDFLCHATQQ